MIIDCHIGKHTINHMKIKEEPMKKIIAVILALTMLLALAACTAHSQDRDNHDGHGRRRSHHHRHSGRAAGRH